MTTRPFFQRTILTVTLLFAIAVTAMAQHDQQLGPKLLFNYYTSDLSQPWAQNTKFTVSNVNNRLTAQLHIYFMPGTGGVQDFYLTLAPLQTTSFLASETVPGETGFALMVDEGRLPSNSLVGIAAITLASGHRCTLPAVAFKSSDSGKTAKLMMDMLPSPQDGQFPLLVVNNLNGASAFNGRIRGGTSVGTFGENFGGSNQITRVLDDSLESTPLLSTLLPASGKFGWLEISARGFFGPPSISGCVLYFSPNTGVSTGSFTGGYNLRRIVTP